MKKIIDNQREFFKTNKTKSLEFRLDILKRLKSAIKAHKQELFLAFKKDYNKCEFDVVATELSLTLGELDYFIKNLNKLSRPKRVGQSLFNFPAKNYVFSVPFGVVLVVAPWNYPFQLSMLPLIGAIACGNTVVLKSSNNTPTVSKVIGKILSVFDKNLIYHTYSSESDRKVLFDQKYDFVFYTGSKSIAHDLVMRQSAVGYCPMVLELGGKSPCIVNRDAHLETSVRRVLWGKFLNGGQTCVAPDFLLLHKEIKDEWIKAAKQYILDNYYEGGKLHGDYTHIINEKTAKRLKELIENSDTIVGGGVKKCQFEPTLINNVKWEDAIMQDEIFGPILPVIEFDDLDKVITKLNSLPTPLACYYFGSDKQEIEKVIENLNFGGGAINDTIMHVAERHLPFGGLCDSGAGNYHGVYSFNTFSHKKSVLVKNRLELKTKYFPYSEGRLKFINRLFKI